MKKQNELFKKVFEYMEAMGWNLNNNTYKDFMDTYKAHMDYMDDYLIEHEDEDDETIWAFQFIGDFLYCLEKIAEKE